MHAEAIEERAKWEGAAKQARGEAHTFNFSQNALDAASREVRMMLLREGSNWGTKACEEMGRTFMVAYHRALKPPPASGEQINAAGQASGQPHFARGQENKPAPAAPNTAPQDVSGTKVNQPAQAVAGLNDAEPVSERPFPAAAVPDDPVAVYERIRYEAGREHTRSKALRALAAHYEAKGMRRAAEQVRILAGRQGLDEDREFVYCIAGQIEEAAKEADRGRR